MSWIPSLSLRTIRIGTWTSEVGIISEVELPRKLNFVEWRQEGKKSIETIFLSEIWHFHWLSNKNEVEYLVEILFWTVVAAVVLSISVTIVSTSFTMMVMSAATSIISTSVESATSTIVIISTVIPSVATWIGFVWPLFECPSGVELILISTRWWFPMIIVCRIGFDIDPVFPTVILVVAIGIVVTSTSALSLIIISLEGVKDSWKNRWSESARVFPSHSADPTPFSNISDYISNYKAHAMNRENKSDNIPTVISII